MIQAERFTKSLLLLLGLFMSCVSTVQAWTVELTETELQDKINKLVPFEKNKLLLTLLVSAIDVELKEGSELIGLVVDMEIKSTHFSSGKGRAYVAGRLTYRPDEGSFYFQDAKVSEVHFENIPDKHHELLRALLQRALQKRLTGAPIYQLDKTRIKHKLARAVLKSVKVLDRKLVLEMGLM